MPRPIKAKLAKSVLAPLPEFVGIAKLLGSAGLSRDGFSAGDDAALLAGPSKQTYAVTTDISFEGVHFRLEWCDLAGALEKAILSNLSDVNAMGGTTTHLFLGLGLGKNWPIQSMDMLGKKLRLLQKRYQFKVVGGDTVHTNSKGFFSITALGPLQNKPLLRSNAKAGDTLYLSGPLGKSQGGLWLLGQSSHKKSSRKSTLQDKLKISSTIDTYHQSLIKAHLFPTPPLGLGPELGSLQCKIATIDTSDGFSSECWHLSRSSNCRLVIEQDKLPIPPELLYCFGKAKAIEAALHGGEDYQLLIAAPANHKKMAELAKKHRLYSIGRVEEGSGVFIEDVTGKKKALKAGGYQHLSVPKPSV